MLDGVILVSGDAAHAPFKRRTPVRPDVDSAFLSIDFYFNPYQTSSLRREFIEEMERMARWMAKSSVIVGYKDGAPLTKVYINRHLQKILIKAIKQLSFEAFTTTTPLGGHYKKSENQIFLLRPQDHEYNRRETEAVHENGILTNIDVLYLNDEKNQSYSIDAVKPQKGRVIFWQNSQGQVGIPHPEGFIPFAKLDSFNIQNISGSVGKAIREAYAAGLKDAADHDQSKPRIRKEADIAAEDGRDMCEAVETRTSTPRVRHMSAVEAAPSLTKDERLKRYRLAAQVREENKKQRIQDSKMRRPSAIQKERARLEATESLLRQAAEAAAEVAQRTADRVIKKATAATALATDIDRRERVIQKRINWLLAAPEELRKKQKLALTAEKRAQALRSINKRTARNAAKIAERARREVDALIDNIQNETTYQQSRAFGKEQIDLNAARAKLRRMRCDAIDAAGKVGQTQQLALAAEERFRLAAEQLMAHRSLYGAVKELPKWQRQLIGEETEKSLKRQKHFPAFQSTGKDLSDRTARKLSQPDVINGVLRTGMTSRTFYERARPLERRSHSVPRTPAFMGKSRQINGCRPVA